MNERDKEEFCNAIRKISYFSRNLENPYDRVRVSEWVRRLSSLEDDNWESSKKKNEYIQLLMIQISHRTLQPPFTNPPPDGVLPHLAEILGDIICKAIPNLPKPGLIAPSILHKSPDGRAYVSIKQIPNHGVLCYMSVNSECAPQKKK